MLDKINDKSNVLQKVHEIDRVVLELGCGQIKKYSDSIGIDLLDYADVDIVGDVFDVLAAFPSMSVHRVMSSHFFEHVEDTQKLMCEISRVLKINGTVEITVPHFSNPLFYSDPTHKSFFGLYSMSYFSKNDYFYRKVPPYCLIDFNLVKVNLCFKSSKPYYIRYAVKKMIGAIFNLNKYMQEFYEENLCYIFPCYEIYYSLKKVDD